MGIKDNVWNLLTKKVHELDEGAATLLYSALSEDQKTTLAAVVESGPLWDGDVPSNSAKHELIDAGLLVPVILRDKDGHVAATYLGGRIYKYARMSNEIGK